MGAAAHKISQHPARATPGFWSPQESQNKAGNSRVKPLGRRSRKITVAAFVRGGGRETLGPLCRAGRGGSAEGQAEQGGSGASRGICPLVPGAP